LRDFKNRDSTDDYERYHNTNESDDMLKMPEKKDMMKKQEYIMYVPIFKKKNP